MADRTVTENTLGQEFWVQPENVLSDTFSLMYTQTLEVLRNELRERSGSVLDYMLAERIAFLYAYLRQREADPTVTFADRNRREMNKDWLELATSMKKLWNSEDKTNQAEVIMKKIERAVVDVVKDLPEGQSRNIQLAFADALEHQGLG